MKKILAAFLGLMLTLSNPVLTLSQTQNKQDSQDKIVISSGEVLLDLVVRDKRNRFVKDLTPADFEVYEDGVPQKVESFRLITRESEAGKPEDKKTTPPGNTSAANTPISLENSYSTVALVFDNLKTESRPFACQAAQAYTSENTTTKDYVGVFSVGLTLNSVQVFTRDPNQIKKAIESVKSISFANTSSPGAGLDKRPSFEQLQAYQQAAGSGPAGGASGPLAINIKMAQMTSSILESFAHMEAQQRGQAVVNSLMAIIQTQQQLSGRKAIIFFSDELTIVDQTQQQFSNIISAANKANVTIYTVDAAGLRTESLTNELAKRQQALSAASIARASAGDGFGGPMTKDLEKNETLVAQGGNTRLAQLANGTGGFLVSDTNDMAKRLGRVDEDLRTYYLITYASTNQNNDGRFRQIEVKLKRPNVFVQSRRGYFAVGSGNTIVNFETPVLAVLSNSTPPSAFAIKSQALSFPQATATARVPVIAQIPTSAVSFVEDKTKKTWETDLRVVALIKDQNKQVVQKLSQQFQLNGAMDKLEETKRNPLLFYSEAELPSGKYEIDIAAYDTPTSKATVQHSTIDVAAEGESKLSLSSVIIVHSASKATETQKTNNLFVVNDLLLVPNLGEAIHKGTTKQFSFYFVVRPAKGGAAPTAVLEILQKGQALAQLPLPLPAADATGRMQVASSLPSEGFPPGIYEMRVTVQDGQSKVSRSANFTIEQ